MGATEKHQIQCTELEWARATEDARRKGVTVGRLLMSCHEESQRKDGRIPLVTRAGLSPIATGDQMLGHLLVEGTVAGACAKLGALREQWDEAVKMIPGLREKIDICTGVRRG